MSYGKGFALALGFVGAMAIGAAIGPYVIDHSAATRPASTSRVAPATMPQADRAVDVTKPAAPGKVAAETGTVATPASITPASPELHAKLRPLFVFAGKPDMTRVSAGFRDAEQFAAVAHAARNTNIPFALLRYRVIEKNQSLEGAIRELKPDVDAKIEAMRAVAEARSDIAAIGA